MGCRCRRILFSVAIRLYPLDTTCECLGVCNDRYLKNGLKSKLRSADYRKLVCSNPGKHGNSYINGEKSTKLSAILDSGGGGGGGRLLRSIFAGYLPLASQSPYPIKVYFLANNKPHLSHF